MFQLTLSIFPNPIPKAKLSGPCHAMTIMIITFKHIYAQLWLQDYLCLHTELPIQECRSEMDQYVLWVQWENLQL